jgi:hypothetical protein
MPKMVRYSFHRFLDDYYDNEMHDDIYEKNTFDIKKIYMIIPYSWHCIYDKSPPISLVAHCLSNCVPIHKFEWKFKNDIPYMRFMNENISDKDISIIKDACSVNPKFPYDLEKKDLICYEKISNNDICKKIENWSNDGFQSIDVEIFLYDYTVIQYVDQSMVIRIFDFFVKFYDKINDYYRFTFDKMVLPQTRIIETFNRSLYERYIISTLRTQWISEKLSNDWHYRFSFGIAESLLRYVKLNNLTLKKCLSMVDQSMLSRFTYSPQILSQSQITNILTKCIEDTSIWLTGTTPFTIRTKFNKNNTEIFRRLQSFYEEDEYKQVFYLNYYIDQSNQSPIWCNAQFLNLNYASKYCDIIVNYWLLQDPLIHSFQNILMKIHNQNIVDILYTKMVENGIFQNNEMALMSCRQIITKINISENVCMNSIKRLKICMLPNPDNKMFQISNSLMNQIMKLKNMHIPKKSFFINCIIHDRIDESILNDTEFSPDLWKLIQFKHRRYSPRFLSIGNPFIDLEDAKIRIDAYYTISKLDTINDDIKNIIMQFV